MRRDHTGTSLGAVTLPLSQTDRPVAPMAIRLDACLSDEDLMRRVQADETPAFDELYHRYSASAFGLASVICRSYSRAEEAAQEGFIAIWRSRKSYDPSRGNARTWLLMVIRNRSIDVMRKGGGEESPRELGPELDSLQAPGSIADDIERHDAAERLRLCLCKLPLCQREVIALAYFGGLSHSEVASRLELPMGTVKGRIRLGLHKVRSDIIPLQEPGQTVAVEWGSLVNGGRTHGSSVIAGKGARRGFRAE